MSSNETNSNEQRVSAHIQYADLIDNLGTISFYVIAAQCIIGLIGNTISLIVWIWGKRSSKLASSTYFKFLAASDVFSLIYRVFDVLSRPPISAAFMYSDVACVIDTFLFYFALQLPTWIVVCLSIERTLSLCFPFKFNTKGSPKRAKISFLLILLVITPPNLIRSLRCDIFQLQIYDIYQETMKFSAIYLLCVIPFLIITVCNVVSVVTLCFHKKIGASDKGRRRIATKLTRLSLGVGVLQCVAIFPGMIYNIENYHGLRNLRLDYEGVVTFAYVCDMLLYLNNTFDFLLYSLSSRDFRQDCKELLSCKR